MSISIFNFQLHYFLLSVEEQAAFMDYVGEKLKSDLRTYTKTMFYDKSTKVEFEIKNTKKSRLMSPSTSPSSSLAGSLPQNFNTNSDGSEESDVQDPISEHEKQNNVALNDNPDDIETLKINLKEDLPYIIERFGVFWNGFEYVFGISEEQMFRDTDFPLIRVISEIEMGNIHHTAFHIFGPVFIKYRNSLEQEYRNY